MLDFVPDYYNDLSVKLRKENARIEGEVKGHEL